MTLEQQELEYNRARTLYANEDLESLNIALDTFTMLGDYKDSNKFLNLTKEKINQANLELEEKKQEDYDRAIFLMKEKKSAYRLDQAIKIFASLEDYKDSKEKLGECEKQRIKVMKRDKKTLDRFKLIGYLCAGIGGVIIAFIICAVIWSIVSNGGAE